MLNYTNQNKIHNLLKHLVYLTLHLLFTVFLVYTLLTIISVILPIAFEFLYTLSTHIFYMIIPSSILISSILVILLPNPIYALIALILVFLNTAIFLVSIKVQFLALIYLIVYIGAIAILFLFVIMLFNLRSLQKSDLKIKDFSFLTISFKFYFFFGLKFFLILALDIWNLVEYSTYFNKEAVYNQFDLQYFLTYIHWDILLFSNLFYTYYSYTFLLSGLVLLAAMIGSIVLALSTTENFQQSFLGANEKTNSNHTQKDVSVITLAEFSQQRNGISFSEFWKNLRKLKVKLLWEQILWVLHLNGWRPHMLHFPVLVFVRHHVSEFSNEGGKPLALAETAKASDPSLIPVEGGRYSDITMPDDSVLAKHGYVIVFTDWAWDHKRNQIVKFWSERSLKDPNEHGFYHEWLRQTVPWNMVTSAKVKEKAGLKGKDRFTWFDRFFPK